jgi:hypothetical protein
VFANRFITRPLPFDQLLLSVGGQKVTGSATKAILNYWGASEARQFFQSKQIVNKRDFDLVYWDGMESVMGRIPEMFRVWVTKHVSRFCGTNRQLSKYDKTVRNVCPSCGRQDESTSHITRCKEEGRTKMFEASVESLVTWLRSVRTGEATVALISE